MKQPLEPPLPRAPLEVRVVAAPAGAVGRCLAQLRQDRGLSVEELARRSGVADRVILALERGACRYPGGTALLALAGAVGVPAEALLSGEDGRVMAQRSARDRRGDSEGRARRAGPGVPSRVEPQAQRARPEELPGSGARRRRGKRADGSADQHRA